MKGPSIITTLVFILGLVLVGVGCAKGPIASAPPIGTTITIMPMASSDAGSGAMASEPNAVKLSLSWNGQPVSASGNLVVRFYEEDQTKHAYSFRWADLVAAYEDPSCSYEMIATLDDLSEETALVCDGRIDFNKVTLIDAIDQSGDVASATSWGTVKVSDEVNTITIALSK